MAQDPYAKAVGDIGEQIVDDYYTKILGFQRESSPDYRVDRKYSTPKTKNTVYVEIIARRITTIQIVPAFYIDKDKVERLKNFQEDYGTVTLVDEHPIFPTVNYKNDIKKELKSMGFCKIHRNNLDFV